MVKTNDLEIYSTFNERKAIVVERFNKTLKKNKIDKQFTVQGNSVWYNILDDLVDKYNDTKHSSIM